MQWSKIVYSEISSIIPPQRWGHRMITTSNDEILLFGGFGGISSEGQYLNDIWVFSTASHCWSNIETTGEIPQNRSNYTLHYDKERNQIILFGGGASNRMRFNDVCILDWKTKIWRKFIPQQSMNALWERTYHSSEFEYPYLIVHGGQSISNLDLDDLWVFNICSKKWNKIEFQEKTLIPKKRRFHATALLDGYFYVAGGCTGNYHLLGDLHRVDLRPLLLDGLNSKFNWERLIDKDKLLERWGHSSNIYNGKIYFSCGRISSQLDSSETFFFDPITRQLTKLQVQGITLSPRRRHSSALIGNSLLIFGGYNGKYLNDFYYMPLYEINAFNLKVSILTVQEEKFMKQLTEKEKTITDDITIIIQKDQVQIARIPSHKKSLQNNPLMKNLLKFSNNNFNEKIFLELPNFCSIENFRIINYYLNSNQILLFDNFNKEKYCQLVLSLEYFLCFKSINAVEDYMMLKCSKINCFQMLDFALAVGFPRLQLLSSSRYFSQAKIFSSKIEKNQLSNCQLLVKDSLSWIMKNYSLKQQILILYKMVRFSIQQNKIRDQKLSFFEKAAKTIQKVFTTPSKNLTENETQRGCFQKFRLTIFNIFQTRKIFKSYQ